MLSLVSGLAMAGFSLAGWHMIWAIAIPHWAYSFAHGVHQPCSQAGAIGPFPQAAGTAAALSGFVMMAAAFVAGLVYARMQNGTALPLTLGCGAAGIAVALTAWTLVQRHGEPRTLPLVVPEPA